MADFATRIAAPLPVGGHTLAPKWLPPLPMRGNRGHITTMSNAETSSHRDTAERRSNPRLRELVDEMLASIRAAANVDLWTAEERDRYEADMARIMQTVRTHAVRGEPRAQLD
jgi:hypothetical protein